jgi:hypothetical protein
LAEVQTELDTAEQQLSTSHEAQTAAEHEVEQLQQRIKAVREELASELDRVEEARRAVESAERHAQSVRARVQREAKRVADLAAAAVMAAAAGGTDTGEFPQVTIRTGGAGRSADEATDTPAGAAAPDQEKPSYGNGHAVNNPIPAADTVTNPITAGHMVTNPIPLQREPQPPERVTADLE